MNGVIMLPQRAIIEHTPMPVFLERKKRVFLHVRTCELVFCFAPFVFLGSIVLTSLSSLFTSPVGFTGSYTEDTPKKITVHYTCCLKLPYFNLTRWQTIIFRNIWDYFVFFACLLENIWRWTLVRFRPLLFVKDILLFTLPAYSRQILSSNRSLLSMRGILLG